MTHLEFKMYLALFDFLFFVQISLVSPVPSQLRNNTLQLCCHPTEYFDMFRYKCATILEAIDINWNLKISYFNKTEDVNILENFHHIINLPCSKPEAVDWLVNKSVDINEVIDKKFCLTPFYFEDIEKNALVQLDCSLESLYFFAFKHEYIYFSSGFLLIPTLIVYILLKPLNENLMGKCFIGYLSSVLVTNCFYFIIPQMLLLKYRFPNLVYISIGLMHFYFNMAIVYWLNVLGFDAWKNFSSSYGELNSFEKRKRFIFYSIYVWSMSVITTLPTMWRNFRKIFDHCNQYKQSKSCVILTYVILYTDIYFAPAVMIILAINFLIFCSVSWKVYKIRGNFACTVYNERFFKENSTVCLRLFLLMGPQWIVIYLLKNYKHIEILIVCLNYIESTLIFILFVLKKSVLRLLCNKWT